MQGRRAGVGDSYAMVRLKGYAQLVFGVAEEDFPGAFMAVAGAGVVRFLERVPPLVAAEGEAAVADEEAIFTHWCNAQRGTRC